MRMGHHALTAIIAVAIAGAAQATARAAVIWTPSSGSNSNFSYLNGQDVTGLLGTGAADPAGFTFVPAGFLSSSSNGASSSASDTATVELTAAPGSSFTTVSAHLLGDFVVSGIGTANSTGSLAVTNLSTLATLTLPVVFTGVPAVSVTSTSGSFDGLVNITLPAGWTHVQIQLSDALSDTTGVGGSALIQTKLIELNVGTTLPEPTAALATLGLAAIIRRRRAR